MTEKINVPVSILDLASVKAGGTSGWSEMDRGITQTMLGELIVGGPASVGSRSS